MHVKINLPNECWKYLIILDKFNFVKMIGILYPFGHWFGISVYLQLKTAIKMRIKWSSSYRDISHGRILLSPPCKKCLWICAVAIFYNLSSKQVTEVFLTWKPDLTVHSRLTFLFRSRQKLGFLFHYSF